MPGGTICSAYERKSLSSENIPASLTFARAYASPRASLFLRSTARNFRNEVISLHLTPIITTLSSKENLYKMPYHPICKKTLSEQEYDNSRKQQQHSDCKNGKRKPYERQQQHSDNNHQGNIRHKKEQG